MSDETKIVALTQGHLEDYQAAFREAMQAVNEKWRHEVKLEKPHSPELQLTLAPLATHAHRYYLTFLGLVRERTNNGPARLSREERYGLMIRAAISTGWLKDSPWKVEEVRTFNGRLAAWLGHQLDETYSDYDFDVDQAVSQAAFKAGWFNGLVALPEEPADIEALAQLARNAYRAATELDPE